MLAGEATPAQIGAFLTLLHAKGETAEEVTGLARAMVDAAVPCPLGRRPTTPVVVDLVGTGGDRLASINVTTLASFITAGAGVPVCKHGNRAASSSVGHGRRARGAGRRDRARPRGRGRAAWPRPAWGSASPSASTRPCASSARCARSSACRTVFNFLGPLDQPGPHPYQLVGVSDPAMAPIMAGVFGATGSRRTFIVHADDGLDELSVTSPSTVLEVRGDGAGALRASATGGSTRPRSGSRPATLADLRGGDAAFNAEVIRSVLEGETGARRDIGVLNAAAALWWPAGSTTSTAGSPWPPSRSTAGGPLGVLDALVATSQAALRRPAGLTRQARRGAWVVGSSAGESGRHKAMTQPPNPPPVMRAPRTPGWASSCSTSSSTAGTETR